MKKKPSRRGSHSIHKHLPPPKRRPSQKKSSPATVPYVWAIAALEGTQDIVRDELTRRFGKSCSFLDHPRNDEIHLRFTDDPRELLSLSTAQTLLLRRDFDVIRPRTLLSPEHTAAIVRLFSDAQNIKGVSPPASFRFDAAGSGSPTMRRIAEQVEKQLGIPFDPENGDGVLVFRPGKPGWEVMCRVGNRPLATRDWRRVNYLGSLNAAIASCMVELTRPARGNRYLNLMCGSGTLLIERLRRLQAQLAVGIDISDDALTASRHNLEAAGFTDRVRLISGDAQDICFPDASFDAIATDLPWGERLGSRETNLTLYRGTFKETARVCRAGGKWVVLTQDIDSIRSVLAEAQDLWNVIDERTILQRGYQPFCATLQRK